MCVARYTLAVERRFKNDDSADFIPVVAFGKSAEFIQKHVHKATKLIVSGRIQTGSYEKDDGTKVYTTEVVADVQEFAESKASASEGSAKYPNASEASGAQPRDALSAMWESAEELELPFV